MRHQRFRDRHEAGEILGVALAGRYASHPDLIILGLPRGGVPVAYGVAEALEAPLDVFVVRKLGLPGHEELAMGAIASGGVRVMNRDVLATGSTMRAAVRALRAMSPRTIVVAVPVGAPSTCQELRAEADDVVCLRTPEPFEAVGLWYDDFEQTTDDEVHALLKRLLKRRLRHE